MGRRAEAWDCPTGGKCSMKKRIISMFMTAALVLSLASCTQGGDSGASETTPSTQESTKTAESEEIAQQDSEAPEEEAGPVENIKVVITSSSPSVPPDFEKVIDEVNKISLEKINTTVEMVPLSINAYKNQMTLMLSSGEELDLMLTGLYDRFDYTMQVARGQLMPLDDLLDQYGSDVKEVLGEDFLNASRYQGNIYAVTTLRDLAKGDCLQMDAGLVEKYDIDPTEIVTLESAEDMLMKIKEAEPDIIPILPDKGGNTLVRHFSMFENTDTLGDDLGGAILMNKDELVVSNSFESPKYAEALKIVRRWYENGLTLQDVASNQTSAFDMMKAGRLFSFPTNWKPGQAGDTQRNTGKEVVIQKDIISDYSNTYSITSWMWAIPNHSQKPEAAMKFLNLLYSDADVINLMTWGIEGEHYQKLDDNVIGHPEGIDATTNGYVFNVSWIWGDTFKEFVWEGDDPEIHEQMRAFNNEASKSAATGFMFDSSNVKTEYAAVNSVISKYKVSLENGAVDPEVVLPQFIEELKAGGIDRIVEEKQAQLDEWATSR